EKCSDFSPYVAAVARRFGAEVTLLHVIDWNPLPYYGADPALGMAIAMTDGFRERRQEELDQFLTDVFTGVPVKRVTQLGEAGATIAAYAATNAIDLIMMPTHGYGRFRSLLLGSVTAKVLHDATCPVWTSAHTPQILSLGMPDFRQILCAVEPAAESV